MGDRKLIVAQKRKYASELSRQLSAVESLCHRNVLEAQLSGPVPTSSTEKMPVPQLLVKCPEPAWVYTTAHMAHISSAAPFEVYDGLSILEEIIGAGCEPTTDINSRLQSARKEKAEKWSEMSMKHSVSACAGEGKCALN